MKRYQANELSAHVHRISCMEVYTVSFVFEVIRTMYVVVSFGKKLLVICQKSFLAFPITVSHVFEVADTWLDLGTDVTRFGMQMDFLDAYSVLSGSVIASKWASLFCGRTDMRNKDTLNNCSVHLNCFTLMLYPAVGSRVVSLL